MGNRRVYKFYSRKWGFEALRNRRLKVSTLKDVNDPFEFLGVAVNAPDIRKIIKTHRENYSKKYGFISFCKQWSNPVIWSHYADGHRGIALGFDVPTRLVNEMTYCNNRLNLCFDQTPTPDELDQMQNALLDKKFDHWKYEMEMRMHFSFKDEIPECEIYFDNFGDNLKLKEVILGAEYKVAGRECLQRRLEDSGVKFTTARLDFETFSVVKQEDSELNKTLSNAISH